MRKTLGWLVILASPAAIWLIWTDFSLLFAKTMGTFGIAMAMFYAMILLLKDQINLHGDGEHT